MTISQSGATRRSARRQTPHLMALPPWPPEPAITVPQALQAIEEVSSELSPRTYAALKAISDALQSLANELQATREHGDRLQRQVDSLEARIGTSTNGEPPTGYRARSPRPWTPDEDRRLVELAAQAVPINRAAMHLDRSYWTVWRRARLLGLTQRRNPDARARGGDPAQVNDRLLEVLRAFLERVASPAR